MTMTMDEARDTGAGEPEPSRRLTVIQIGNFGPPHSTENHLAIALEANGHRVIKLQENAQSTFTSMSNIAGWPVKPDFILWTRTGWNWEEVFGSEDVALGLQRSMLRIARMLEIPTVAYHLDRWWGLNREHQLDREPFFSCDRVITADGSNDDRFAGKGINHTWFLPAVSRSECEPGRYREEFASKIAFVGSWQGHYHEESTHRHALVQHLRNKYRHICEFWPRHAHPAVRGVDLRDLYASVDVVIGDSCFSGDGIGKYCSDRIPETLGRGGFLLHPDTLYVTTGQSTPVGPAWLDASHLCGWEAFNWDDLDALIEWALTHPARRREIAAAGRAFTLEHHTYERRMEQVVALLGLS